MIGWILIALVGWVGALTLGYHWHQGRLRIDDLTDALATRADDLTRLRTMLASAEADSDQAVQARAAAQLRAEAAEICADDLDSTVAILKWQLASAEQAADWHEGAHTCLPHLDGIRELSAGQVLDAVDRMQAGREVTPITAAKKRSGR